MEGERVATLSATAIHDAHPPLTTHRNKTHLLCFTYILTVVIHVGFIGGQRANFGDVEWETAGAEGQVESSDL